MLFLFILIYVPSFFVFIIKNGEKERGSINHSSYIKSCYIGTTFVILLALKKSRKIPMWNMKDSSKYSLNKIIGLAMDGVTSFPTFPLKIANYAGVVFLIIPLLSLIVCGITTGVTTVHVILFSILFGGGLIMLMLRMIGMYVGRVFEQR